MSSESKTNVRAFQQHLFERAFSYNKYLASYFELRAETHAELFFCYLKCPDLD